MTGGKWTVNTPPETRSGREVNRDTRGNLRSFRENGRDQNCFTYLVADGSRRSPRITHFDRLKLYNGDKNPNWMKNYQNQDADDKQSTEATVSQDEQYDTGSENSD